MSVRRVSWLGTYYLLLLVALYIPLVILLLFSANNSPIFAFPLSGFTLRWYSGALSNEELLAAVWNSTVVAVGSSLAATALGTLAGIALTRFRFRGKVLFVGVAMVPLLVPYIILGVALLVLFSALNVERSLWTIGIAHTIVSLPYTLLIIMARMVGFDQHLEEAAADLGATYPVTLWRVILPMIASAMLAGWLVAFTVSFDEFVLASFLIGRDKTLPVYLFSQRALSTRFPQIVALAMVVMVISIGLVLFAEWLQRRGADATLGLRIGQGEAAPDAAEGSLPSGGVS